MFTLKSNLGIVSLILAPHYCLAANGINLIGFGTESVGMGGADLAVARDSSALNINPAGLSQIQDSQLDIYAAHASSNNTKHTDVFGNNIKADVGGSFIEFAYANKLKNDTLTWGAGLFVQGGIGAKYKNMNTAFGTEDTLSSELAIIRFTPGLAWQVNPETSLGVTVLITYATGSQEFFPNTSFNGPTSEQSFYGLKVSDASTFEPALKLGLMHRLNKNTKLGIAYTSETELTLDNGNATMDFTALGLGKVNYSNASLGGLNLPQEIGVGLSHQYSEKWFFAVDISWLNWRSAAKATFIHLSNPDNDFAPVTISQSQPLNWENQTVLAIGSEYKNTDKSVIRFGFNIANNPVPENFESPTLSAIATKHITAGYRYSFNQGLHLSTAIEYQLSEKKTYTNNSLPFGSNATIELDVLIIHIMLSSIW
ncbi:MAG: outer membrane protein transport protein [Gammaproteobacteria bacterium]|nr:outer membrane protein transport protein [Gammaproteobacteria bacterium]